MADIKSTGLYSKDKIDLDIITLNAFEILIKRFINNVPKSFSLKDGRKPISFFTDGSCENDVGMVGGILLERDVSLEYLVTTYRKI